jgi:ribosomal protein S11
MIGPLKNPRIERFNKLKKKVKSHFTFFFNERYGNQAYLMFSKSHSNIFVTLLDSKFRVIAGISSGIALVGYSKRSKVATQALELIMEKVNSYFVLYRIRCVEICLKTLDEIHIAAMLKELNHYRVPAVGFTEVFRLPHNGVRKRKIRRV